MDFDIRPLGEHFGVEIVGLDLSRPLSDETFERIRQAWFGAGVMVIRDQQITPEQHIAFSRRFGPLIVHVMDQYLLPGHPEILRISNKKNADGAALGFEDAGRYWHSDVSYEAEPALGSMLYALEIPPEGGDTLFADMCRALATLPDATRERIAGRRAFHSYTRTFERNRTTDAGKPEMRGDQRARLTDVSHPIVRTIEETGEHALFVNPGFTYAVDEMADAESDALLAELFAHCERDEFRYAHKWRERDLLCWDNRTVMHHATLYDPAYTRHMHRTTIKGTRPA